MYNLGDLELPETHLFVRFFYMAGYEQKTREIKRSLNRRARIRRNYFKLIGEDPRTHKPAPDASKSSDNESDDENKDKKNVKLTGKQLASRKRAMKHHQKLDEEKRLADLKFKRESHKRTMRKTTKSGQPKLGSQIGVLLDKIKKNQ